MLEINHLSKEFVNGSHGNRHQVLQDLSLTVQEGEFFSLLGPSGCGKSTLLRILAGLESATGGEIVFRGQKVDGLPAQRRPFNMVFQKYALFPHLSVFENIAFGLRLKKLARPEIEDKVKRVLDLTNLRGFESRTPETLSGGQAQRVAIARALVNEPAILLLDEPLSALDLKLREHMRDELKRLQRRMGITFIYVTHDQEEALTLSDRIAVMNQGRLEQVSGPHDLYHRPQTLFAAQFIGATSKIEGDFDGFDGTWGRFQVGGDTIRAKVCQDPWLRTDHQQAVAMIRPECLQIEKASDSISQGNILKGVVSNTVFRGSQTEIHVDLGSGRRIHALIPFRTEAEPSYLPGQSVQLSFKPEDAILFLGQHT